MLKTTPKTHKSTVESHHQSSDPCQTKWILTKRGKNHPKQEQPDEVDNTDMTFPTGEEYLGDNEVVEEPPRYTTRSGREVRVSAKARELADAGDLSCLHVPSSQAQGSVP